MRRSFITFIVFLVLPTASCAQDRQAYDTSVECAALAMARHRGLQATQDQEASAAMLYGVRRLSERMQTEGQRLGLDRNAISQQALARLMQLARSGLTSEQVQQADNCLASLTE